jgi:hypothetical protein
MYNKSLSEQWNSFSPATRNAYLCWAKAHILVNEAHIDACEITESTPFDPNNEVLPKFSIGEMISSKIKGTPTFSCAICQQDFEINHQGQCELDIIAHILSCHAAGEYDLIEDPLTDSLFLPESKKKKLAYIHSLLTNEERRDAVRLIEEYGPYDFFADYAGFLEATLSAAEQYDFFKDMTVSYMRIKNR